MTINILLCALGVTAGAALVFLAIIGAIAVYIMICLEINLSKQEKAKRNKP